MKLWDSEDGSTSILVWMVVIIFFGLFTWICLGVVNDKLTNFAFAFSQANPNIPVSQDRVNITNWMIQGWWAWPLIGLILPTIYYTIIISKKRQDTII